MNTAPPYPPSWLDRFAAWVERQPGPPWIIYAALGAAGYLATSVLRWLDGRQPVGAFDPLPPPFLLWALGVLALHHYLDRYARRALEQFRPLIQGDQAQYDRLEYELTVTPARAALVGGALWVVVSAIIVVTTRRLTFSYFPVWEVVISVLTFFMGGAFIQHVLHQMRTVRRIYARVDHVDLYDTQPLMAFSGLTVRAAIGLVLLQYAILAILPGESKLTLVIPSVALTLIAVAVFVWPLRGVHHLLEEEKGEQMAAVEQRLKAAVTMLYQRVDSGELAGMDDVEKTITSLKTTRDLVGSRPTWPWQPATVRGLATAILLPIGLWLLQELLQRLLRL
ncbi:MAG: hypothetical protein IAE85_02265 [Anaerolinea sp.]|nr:hypothetical protein [Anaerolinea sp.]